MIATFGGLIVVLALLIAVYWLALGGWSGFSLSQAILRPRKATGPLAAVWLALVSGVVVLIDVTQMANDTGVVDALGTDITAGGIVTALVVMTAFLLIAPQPTVFVLSVAGVLAWGTQLTRAYGPAAALLVLVITLLATWLFGFLRGAGR